MKSHSCEFTMRHVAQRILAMLLVVAGFAVCVHTCARLGILPTPRPTLDVDRTILIHQADASRRRDPARVLLLGDSSCLMDVSATQLGTALGEPVLNLGTLSYLDVAAQGLLLRNFSASNPGQIRTVILLMHPEALRRNNSEPYQLAVLTNYLAGTDHSPPETIEGHFAASIGADIVQGRLLARKLSKEIAKDDAFIVAAFEHLLSRGPSQSESAACV